MRDHIVLLAVWQAMIAVQGTNTERRVFDPMGHVQDLQKADGTWVHLVPDALGSVRGVVNDADQWLHSQLFNPIGHPWGAVGTPQSEFGFTGEPTEGNGLIYLRARHYSPSLGVFPNLDPLEGEMTRAMSLNHYGYVGADPINKVDPSGRDTHMCAQYLGSAPKYVQCLIAHGKNPCPVGYPVGGNPTDAYDPVCLKPDGTSDRASRLWDVLWYPGPTGVAETLTAALGKLPDFVNYVIDRALILPRIFIENPRVALEALNQVLCTQSGAAIGSGTVLAPPLLGRTPPRVPLQAVIAALFATAIVGVGVLALEYSAERTKTKEEERVEPIPLPPQMKRRWQCTARCNLTAIAPNPPSHCPERSEAIAIGNSEAEACNNAKDLAVAITPQGCYPRHCHCRKQDCYPI